MPEYIEREAACEKCVRYGMGEVFCTDCVVKVASAADVAPVVHGRWEFKNNGRYGQTRCYCTACGKHSGIGGIRKNQLKPYCPNCGARMDGE